MSRDDAPGNGGSEIRRSSVLGYLTIRTIIGRKRIFPLPASSDRVIRRDRADHGMLARLMLAWRRNRQMQLELHLKLTTPSYRWKRGDTPFSTPAADDRYRHHPYVRD
jgi:hypothetical protein